MARNDIEMRITADSRGVAAGLKPMMTSLDSAQTAALETEKALDSIGTTPVKVSVNDEAIAKARAEITRLRNQMREQLSTDVTADTREAERRIKELQRSIKVLDAEQPVVDVVVNTTRIDHLRTSVTAIRDAVSGSGGLTSGLAGATRGMGAVGGAGAAAATGVGAAAAAMVIAGDAAWNLGQMAADAETQVAQLDALTKGMGEETFGQLQEFAAATPFAVDEVTAATKRLVAAGVELEDIPDTISDLGEVAAATGVPIEQISTVFAQMVSKGKASYEELQQLAEAGVPVWSILADKLGLTVAEVQKLATEGKLSADAIKLLQESLAETYSGAMQRQAETFNGQMSTLKDTVHQTGQELGEVFLPAMKDLVSVAIELTTPMLEAARSVSDFNAAMTEDTGVGLLDVISPAASNLKVLNHFLGETGDAAEDNLGLIPTISQAGADALKDVQDQLEADAQAMVDMEKLARALEDAFQDAVSAFQGIGGGVRARVDFIIDQDDLRDEIHKAIEGTKDDKPVTLPADLKIGQVTGLTDAQQDLVGNLSAFATQGLEEGARQADLAHSLGQSFDTEKFYRDLRNQLRPLVIESGIDPENVNKFLDDVLGVPAPWKVKPELTGVPEAQAELDASFPPQTVLIEPKLIESSRLAAGGLVSPDAIERVISGTPRAGAGPTNAEERRPQQAPRVTVLIDGEEVAAHLQRNRLQTLTGVGGKRMP